MAYLMVSFNFTPDPPWLSWRGQKWAITRLA